MNFPIGYGMNLEEPQEVAAKPEPQEATTEPASPMPKRKRARVAGKRYAADDQATAADEAWAES
jgi:hypothetical protein